MKKSLVNLLIVAAIVVLSAFTISCKSAPKSGAPIEGEVTQEKVNGPRAQRELGETNTLPTQPEVDDALRHIYSTYQPKLDMTGAFARR